MTHIILYSTDVKIMTVKTTKRVAAAVIPLLCPRHMRYVTNARCRLLQVGQRGGPSSQSPRPVCARLLVTLASNERDGCDGTS